MSGGQALLALDFFLGPTREIVFVDGSQTTETDAALHALYRHFLPNKLVLRHRGSQSDAALPAVVKPLLSGKHSHAGQPTIYVCEHGTCGLPVTGIEGLEQALVPKL